MTIEQLIQTLFYIQILLLYIRPSVSVLQYIASHLYILVSLPMCIDTFLYRSMLPVHRVASLHAHLSGSMTPPMVRAVELVECVFMCSCLHYSRYSRHFLILLYCCLYKCFLVLAYCAEVPLRINLVMPIWMPLCTLDIKL
jgi:hypothetical protein